MFLSEQPWGGGQCKHRLPWKQENFLLSDTELFAHFHQRQKEDIHKTETAKYLKNKSPAATSVFGSRIPPSSGVDFRSFSRRISSAGTLLVSGLPPWRLLSGKTKWGGVVFRSWPDLFVWHTESPPEEDVAPHRNPSGGLRTESGMWAETCSTGNLESAGLRGRPDQTMFEAFFYRNQEMEKFPRLWVRTACFLFSLSLNTTFVLFPSSSSFYYRTS